jgi:hypothetical protein
VCGCASRHEDAAKADNAAKPKRKSEIAIQFALFEGDEHDVTATAIWSGTPGMIFSGEHRPRGLTGWNHTETDAQLPSISPSAIKRESVQLKEYFGRNQSF